MRAKLGVRFWVTGIGSGMAAVLGVVTTLIPTWIERIAGVTPDGGSGETEWALVAVFAVVALAGAFVARFDWRRTHASA